MKLVRTFRKKNCPKGKSWIICVLQTKNIFCCHFTLKYLYYDLKCFVFLNDFIGLLIISVNCIDHFSHSNSPFQIHSIIFGQSNVSHWHLRRVQKGPPNGSHFYLLLKIQRLLKEQLDKVEDWKGLIFLFLWNETLVLFLLLSFKSRSLLGGL